VIVMLIFGTKKLRNMGADLGGAVRGFKDGMREGGEKPGDANSPSGPAPQVTGKTVEGEVKARPSRRPELRSGSIQKRRPLGRLFIL